MRLLLFNLATDADDPLLGFTTRWIGALAERVEFIHVVTMRAGRLAIPGNVRVHSVGKEKGYSEARRVMEFYKIIGRILRQERIDVCFSHMMPLFTVMAGPILRLMGIPIITWYAHLNRSRILPVAHWLSTRMVASVESAYPYRRDKFTAVGQGIDTALFRPEAETKSETIPLILCVGRLSPVKDHPTLIKAARFLRQVWHKPFRVEIVGGPTSGRDETYVRSLRQQVKQLGLEEIVSLEPAVSMDKLPSWYRRSTVNVNMTPTGSGDKVVWEALACGRICVVANEGFKPTLGKYADDLSYTYGEAEQLAARLNWTLSLSESARAVIGTELQREVEASHGLKGLANRLVEIFESTLAPSTAAAQVKQA